MRDRVRIIDDMVAMYAEAALMVSIEGDINKLQFEIGDIEKHKNKLLDLCVNGRITDDEFRRRNDAFNNEITTLNERITALHVQKAQSAELARNVSLLRRAISEELDFNDGIPQGVVEAQLERIEVYKSDSDKAVHLKVYLRVTDELKELRVRRSRGKDSIITTVCSEPYIYYVSNGSFAFSSSKHT